MRFSPIAMAIALLVLLGCGEEVPGRSSADFQKEREAMQARLEKKKKAPRKQVATATATAGRPDDTTFGQVSRDYSYDSEGKRDPFRSFEWEQTAEFDPDLRGPLEQFDLSQLEVVAVVWNTGNARALIEDPSGKSYVVGEGARIGKNEGRVTTIHDNLVRVKETYVDFLGERTTKDIEMRIRRSQGG